MTAPSTAMPANPFPGLPETIYQAICSAIFTEFGTMTAKGVPIDTPTYSFVGTDGGSVDLATGLAYPAKAERARRNPKVGLLLEGDADTPVVSIAALATVKDSDFQANAERYIAETAAYLDAQSYGLPWSTVREVLWYWTRILVQNRPVRIMWWPNAAALDQPPSVWTAPADFVYPPSDPAPAAEPSKAPAWGVRDWREVAALRLEQQIPCHLTVADDQGFPLPIRTRSARLVDDGILLEVPKGAPWKPAGPASLCFMAMATFVGSLRETAEGVLFEVERALPVLPTVEDPKEVFQPAEETRDKMMARLKQELDRRGASFPEVPLERLAPTAGSQLRAEQMKRIYEETAKRNT